MWAEIRLGRNSRNSLADFAMPRQRSKILQIIEIQCDENNQDRCDACRKLKLSRRGKGDDIDDDHPSYQNNMSLWRRTDQLLHPRTFFRAFLTLLRFRETTRKDVHSAEDCDDRLRTNLWNRSDTVIELIAGG